MSNANLRQISSKDGVILSESDFGSIGSEKVKKYSWKTETGLEISVITYGAIIQTIKYPDKNGVAKDITLGFDTLEDYLKMNNSDLTGCVIGRCANRVKDATITIDGQDVHLDKNWGKHHAHGGTKGFHLLNWIPSVKGNKVTLSLVSKDGDMGYPGDLLININYELKNNDTFYIDYLATTTKKTMVNLTNHTYFNLAGHDAGLDGINEHVVVLNSDKWLESDPDWIPTGRYVPVQGPYDLRTGKKMGDFINNTDDLRYHHNYVITKTGEKDLNFLARVEHPPSGRYMDMYTDQPSVVFYTGNYIADTGRPTMVGKGGAVYTRCSGLCLEPQNMIDAVHHPHFPSPLLAPGDLYTNKVTMKFGLI